MSQNSIVGKAFRINEFDYFNCPKDIAVSCEALIMGGVVWFIPTSKNGVTTGYQQRRSATKPTPDSVKTVRVKDTISGTTYWILINDTDTASVITDTCAACCGQVVPLAAVIIPPIVIEEQGCLEPVDTTSNTYRYFSIASTAGAGQVYGIYGSKNGVAFSPAAPTVGFASVAAATTWANANWGSYGTFTSVGQKITFESANATTGFLQITVGTTPTANAGPDQSLVSGTTSTTLTSAASTAGAGSIVSRAWTKVSGPGTQVITTPTGTTTTVTGLQAGTFVFSLTVTNSAGVTNADTISVVVAA